MSLGIMVEHQGLSESKALYYERYHSGRRVAILGKYLSHDLAFVAFGIVEDVRLILIRACEMARVIPAVSETFALPR